jgi:hypothetical protein
VSAVVFNIVIGLVTSVLSGGSVWTWHRAALVSAVRRKAAFFGLEPGGTCLIVMNNHWQKPGSTSHYDVHAMIEVAALAHESGCPITVIPADELHEGNDDRTEFCIGGPTSNPRTAGHLAAHLPGVSILPYSAERDSGAIAIGSEQFLFERGRLEHVTVAKFTPVGSSRPVFVICGHRSIDNRAAILFLTREYRNLSKSVGSLDRFCLVLRVNASDTYGHQATELVADVTAVAFAPHHTPPVTTGNSPQS